MLCKKMDDSNCKCTQNNENQILFVNPLGNTPLVKKTFYRPNLICAPAKCHRPLINPWYSTASPYPVVPLLLSPVQYISVSRICHGGYPSSFKKLPNIKRRSGSGFTETTGWSGSPLPAVGVVCDGCVVISLISASTSSAVISSASNLPFCDISAKVLVKSTVVSRPSVDDRRRRVIELGFNLSAGVPSCRVL